MNEQVADRNFHEDDNDVDEISSFKRRCAVFAAYAANTKKASDILVQNVADLINVTDYFVTVSASNKRQADALLEEIEEKIREFANIKPDHREESQDGSWSLLDYGFMIVHVFLQESREYYRLEELWKDAPIIDLSKEADIEDPVYSERIKRLIRLSRSEA